MNMTDFFVLLLLLLTDQMNERLELKTMSPTSLSFFLSSLFSTTEQKQAMLEVSWHCPFTSHVELMNTQIVIMENYNALFVFLK